MSTPLTVADSGASTSLTPEQVAALPPLQLFIRSGNGIEFRTSPFNNTNSNSNNTATSTATNSNKQYIPASLDFNSVYSTDGKYLSIISNKSVDIYSTTLDRSNPILIQSINRSNVTAVQFSPLNSHIITYERKSTDNTENLRIYNISKSTDTDNLLLKYYQRDEFPIDCWPIQYTADELLIGHLVNNQIQFYNTNTINKGQSALTAVNKLYLNNISLFKFAPNTNQLPYNIAVVLPPKSKSTEPARINIYQYPTGLTEPIASKSVLKCEECSIKWSSTGLSLLIETKTSTDKSGASYYGESNLHLLTTNNLISSTIMPTNGKTGPIQDYAFHPLGNQFLVIQGFQPAVSTLYSIDYNKNTYSPIREYCVASRNTIRFSPHGRFVMIGGFGNLAGEFDLFDCNKFKLIGSAQDRNGAKSFEWTADGRLFITAVLRPWRRVDNGFKIWSYWGELIHSEQYEELYQVTAKPAPIGIYPNRPQSPKLKERKAANVAAVLQSTGNTAAKSGIRVGAYVPPHLRKSDGSAVSVNTVAAVLQKDRENTGPRKLNSNPNQSQQQRTPLITSPTATAVATDSESAAAGDQLTRNQAKAAQKKAKKAREAAEAEAEAIAAAEAAKLAAEAPLTSEEKAKRIKAINKKLKQISDLKAQLSSGAELDSAQQSKIDNESTLLADLEQLQL